MFNIEIQTPGKNIVLKLGVRWDYLKILILNWIGYVEFGDHLERRKVGPIHEKCTQKGISRQYYIIKYIDEL